MATENFVDYYLSTGNCTGNNITAVPNNGACTWVESSSSSYFVRVFNVVGNATAPGNPPGNIPGNIPGNVPGNTPGNAPGDNSSGRLRTAAPAVLFLLIAVGSFII
jgi:hypothetical protein